MNLNTCKLLFELTENSRIPTKELGKKLRISQQGASYLIKTNKDNETIKDFVTIFDPAKFGLINIVVFYDFKKFKKTKINEIIGYHKKLEHATRIENLSEGHDLMVEYTVPNLSFFNKSHEEFLFTFNEELVTMAIYPIIVKHIYPKNYLINKKKYEEIIISGDRQTEKFTEKEMKIITYLNNNTRITTNEISSLTGHSTKTIISIRKDLERRQIIRKYSTDIDFQKIDALKHTILLSISLEDKEHINKFISYCMNNNNITSATKIIGHFNIMITTEQLNHKIDVLVDIRKNFDILEYKVIKNKNRIKYITIPSNIDNIINNS